METTQLGVVKQHMVFHESSGYELLGERIVVEVVRDRPGGHPPATWLKIESDGVSINLRLSAMRTEHLAELLNKAHENLKQNK